MKARELLRASADDFDAISHALTMKPGDKVGALELIRKGVENGAFGWWVNGGGFISLNNLIAEVRIARNGARFPAALRALASRFDEEEARASSNHPGLYGYYANAEAEAVASGLLARLDAPLEPAPR